MQIKLNKKIHHKKKYNLLQKNKIILRNKEIDFILH
jgi:hypothetical protein